VIVAKYPNDLLKLIAHFRKLPGVGLKTAERFAFQMLSWQDDQLKSLGGLLATIKTRVRSCPTCGCLIEETCFFCNAQNRDPSLLCIVSHPKDVYVIEETRAFQGMYHVLGGLLSPLDGRAPEHLQLEMLKKRVQAQGVKEIILALDSTIEGDATALYLKNQLEDKKIPISRLALGLPMGSSLDFVDGGTLMRALSGRQSF
jgi:recombination protein RecR